MGGAQRCQSIAAWNGDGYRGVYHRAGRRPDPLAPPILQESRPCAAKARSPDERSDIRGHSHTVPDIASLIRACMGLWLSRGMIDQGMCCSWLLSWSALRSQWRFRSDG